MKFLFLLFIVLCISVVPTSAISLYGSEPDSSDLEFIRTKFYEGVEDESKVQLLETFLNKKFYGSRSPVIIAYKGGVEALKARHAFNPFTKLSYLNTSMDSLELAIKLSPADLEIRFVRFSILHHLPGILGYSVEKQEDINVICDLLKRRNYGKLNFEIQKGIVDFMLKSDRLNRKQEEELRLLATQLAQK